MNKSLTRYEAQKIYVDWVMKSGNPEYFVWNAVDKWENHELTYGIAKAMEVAEPEIKDEE